MKSNIIIVQFYVFVFALSVNAFGQMVRMDNKNDPNQIGLFNNVSKQYNTSVYITDGKASEKILEKLNEISPAISRQKYKELENQLVELFSKNKDGEIVALLTNFKGLLEKSNNSQVELAEIHGLFSYNDYINGRYKKALLELEKAIQYNQSDANYAISKAYILQSFFGQSEKAIKLLESYNTIVAVDTAKSNLYHAIFTTYLRNGDLEKSERYIYHWQKLLTKNNFFKNDYIVAYLDLGFAKLHARKGNNVLADDFYNKVVNKLISLRDSVGLVDTYIELADFYIQQERLSGAKEVLNKAIQVAKQHPELDFSDLYRSLANLYIWKQEPGNVEKNIDLALVEARKLSHMLPLGEATVYFKIAYNFQDAGQDSLAIIYFNKVIENLQSEPTLFQHPICIRSHDGIVFSMQRILQSKQYSRKNISYGGCRTLMNNALEIMDNIGWMDHPLNTLRVEAGILSIALGYNTGIELLNQASPFKDFNMIERADFLNNAGLSFLISEDCEEAANLLTKALNIISMTSDYKSRDLTYTIYTNLAYYYHLKRDFSNRDELFKKIRAGYNLISPYQTTRLKGQERLTKGSLAICR